MIVTKKYKVILILSLFITFVLTNAVYASAWVTPGMTNDMKKLAMVKQKVAKYNEAIKLNPKDSEAYFQRGCVCLDEGYNTDAVADFTKVIELNPQRVGAYYNRALAYQKGFGDSIFHESKPGLAIRDYTKYLEVKPGHIGALYNRAQCYADFGEKDLAIADYNAILRIDPGHTEALRAKKELLEVRVKVSSW